MRPPRFSNRTSGRRGVVLIVVLVIITMVALAGFGFLAAMSTEYEAAKLNGSMRQARQTLASAESTVIWFAGLPERHRRVLGGLHHNSQMFRSHIVPQLTANVGETTAASNSVASGLTQPVATSGDSSGIDDRWRFSVVSIDKTPEQQRLLRFGLTNESARLNLSRLMRWEQTQPGAGRAALMQLPGMTESVADCLLDWMDPDDAPREFGAERDHYETLNRPYRPANAVPQSVAELLYVKGVNRQLLLGHSMNLETSTISGDQSTNTIAQSSSASSNDSAVASETISAQTTMFQSDPMLSNSMLAQSWSEFLTFYSAERNLNELGQPRVAINAATIASLEQQLAPLQNDELVRFILLARAYGLSHSGTAGVQPSAAPFASTLQAAYSIPSIADLIDSTVNVSTPSGTIAVQSPLSATSPDFADLFNRLTNYVSTDSGPVIVGRINIMLAPESVLRMIPGISIEEASQIITLRASLDENEKLSMTWLLTRNILDLPKFRRVFPEITLGGDVFQTEIIVHRPTSGPMLRRKVTIDAAANPARRVHWSDVSDEPLSFPASVLTPPL